MNEPIEIISQRAMLPMKYPFVLELYKAIELKFWVLDEIPPFNEDDYTKLSPEVYNMLKYVLLFFGVGDAHIGRNLANIGSMINDPAITMLFDFQKMQENIHNHCYSKLLEQFLTPEKFEAEVDDFLANEYLARVERFIQTKTSTTEYKTLPVLLIFNAMLETVLFSAKFAIIYYIDTYISIDADAPKFPALLKSNAFIARDETAHIKNAAAIFRGCIVNKPPQKFVHDMANEIVELESEYLRVLCPTPIFDMNADRLIQYTKFMTDLTLDYFGYDKLYYVENPFEFMKKILLPDSNNFFDDRFIAEYEHRVENIKYE